MESIKESFDKNAYHNLNVPKPGLNWEKIAKIDTYKYNTLIILFSIFTSWFVVTLNHFPYLGWGLWNLFFGLLVYCLKKNKDIFDKFLLILIELLSVFIFLRANEFLVFLNVLLLIYLHSFNILLINKKRKLGLKDIIFAPIVAFLKVVSSPSVFKVSFTKMFSSKKVTKKNLTQSEKEKILLNPKKSKSLTIFISLIITFVLLIVIIPILASTNPIFSDLIGSLFGNIFNYIFDADLIPLFFYRLVIFGISLLLFPFLLSYLEIEKEEIELPSKTKFSEFLFIPKIAIIIVLFVFFLTQIQLYFADIIDLGDYSKNVNEVFIQLSFVALIVFILIYFDKSRKKIHKITTIFLLIQGIFLSLMAFKSDLDYVYSLGYTIKRLYGFAVVLWILGLINFYFYFYNKSRTSFWKKIILYSGVILVLINIFNFDRIVYKYTSDEDKSKFGNDYLSNLSSDAYHFHPYYFEIKDSYSKYTKNLVEKDFNSYLVGNRLLDKMEFLQNKYGAKREKNYSWQNFNLSEYLQYRKIKNINISKERKEIDKFSKSFYPQH